METPRVSDVLMERLIKKMTDISLLFILIHIFFHVLFIMYKCTYLIWYNWFSIIRNSSHVLPITTRSVPKANCQTYITACFTALIFVASISKAHGTDIYLLFSLPAFASTV